MFFDFIISAKKTNIILGSISIKKGNSIKPRPTWLIDTTKFFFFFDICQTDRSDFIAFKPYRPSAAFVIVREIPIYSCNLRYRFDLSSQKQLWNRHIAVSRAPQKCGC